MTDQTYDQVKTVVVNTLGLEDRAGTLTPDTQLLGNLPELDSMAVLELVEALEDEFGLTIEDDDVTGELFENLRNLTEFVESRRN